MATSTPPMPTTPPPSPPTEPAAPTAPQKSAQAALLAPVQPVRPLGSTAQLASPQEVSNGTDSGKSKGVAEDTTSIPRALLLALVERWRQRPVTAQKRLEVAKERAKARQVKESRNHDIKETRQPTSGAKPESKRPTPESRKNPPGGSSGKDVKPAPKPPVDRKSPTNKSPAPAPPKKPEPPRKQVTPEDRKSPKPPRNPEAPRRVKPEKVRKSPDGQGGKSERPSGPEKTRKPGPESLRKIPESDRKEQVRDRKARNDAPERDRRAPEKPGPQPDGRRKIPAPRRESPEGVRKPTPVIWKAPPGDRKEKAAAAPEGQKDRKAPERRAPLQNAPQRPRPVRPVETQKKDRAWKELPGHRPPAPKGPLAPPAATVVKDKRAQEKEEGEVTAVLERQEVEPIEVKSVDAEGVSLGAGASKAYLTRGEVRSMKQFERRLTARAAQMGKVAERTKGLQAHAKAQATHAVQLAEKARGVKGGNSLLPLLNRLADQAEKQAAVADGIHLRATRAADLARAVLADVKKRDGLIYQAVVDSPETQPAEMAFYKGN